MKKFILLNQTSIILVLAVLSFCAAGFLISKIAGFTILGFCLLCLAVISYSFGDDERG